MILIGICIRHPRRLPNVANSKIPRRSQAAAARSVRYLPHIENNTHGSSAGGGGGGQASKQAHEKQYRIRDEIAELVMWQKRKRRGWRGEGDLKDDVCDKFRRWSEE